MSVSPDKKVLELYKDSADSYDKMMDKEINLPVYADVLSRLANRITDLKGPVVDTSCGSGHMLYMYHTQYDQERALIGVDLSTQMVKIAAKKLGKCASIYLADMRNLESISSGSSAAVISYFAIHHLTPEDIKIAFREWQRILENKGQFVLGAWEGRGVIDYGDASDLVAQRYSKTELIDWASQSGFTINKSTVEFIEDMEMNAVYLEASKE